MLLVDANLLLYAKFEQYPQHVRARSWLERQLGGPTPVALPWTSLLAFLRISSNPRLLRVPLPLDRGVAQVTRWLAAPAAWAPEPTPRHAELLTQLLDGTPYSPKAVTDAHLAALALGHGLIVCSADSGFSRFAGIRWENPAAA